MFIVTRKNQESVIVDGFEGSHREIKVTVLEIDGTSVKLGFDVDTLDVMQQPKCEHRPSSPGDPRHPWEGPDFRLN